MSELFLKLVQAFSITNREIRRLVGELNCPSKEGEHPASILIEQGFLNNGEHTTLSMAEDSIWGFIYGPQQNIERAEIEDLLVNTIKIQNRLMKIRPRATAIESLHLAFRNRRKQIKKERSDAPTSLRLATVAGKQC